MEQHTAAELTFHNDGKQMIGGWQNKFSKFNHPKLIFVVVSSTDKHAVKNQNWQYYNVIMDFTEY